MATAVRRMILALSRGLDRLSTGLEARVLTGNTRGIDIVRYYGTKGSRARVMARAGGYVLYAELKNATLRKRNGTVVPLNGLLILDMDSIIVEKANILLTRESSDVLMGPEGPSSFITKEAQTLANHLRRTRA